MTVDGKWLDELSKAVAINPLLLKQTRRCVSLLRDLLPGEDNRAKINALKMALEWGIPNLLQRDRDTEGNPERSVMRMSKRLENDTALIPEMAEWSVRVWAFSIGWLAKSSVTLGVVPAKSSPSPSTRLEAYLSSAEKGSVISQIHIGDLYSKGIDVPKDDDVAIKWYRKALLGGSDEAKVRLGLLFIEGRGTAESTNEFNTCLDALGKSGDERAQLILAEKYKKGDGVKQSLEEAARWYRKAAEQGNAVAQNELGILYDNGKVFSQDYRKAAEWYLKAASQGFARAQNNLGWMFEVGRGVPQDDSKAVEWYRKAAEQRHAKGQANLGRMYASGRGVPRDDSKAVEWYRKSADQGYATAQCNLGVMYAKGRGVPQSQSMAMEWYRKSAANGNITAKENLKSREVII